MHFWGIQCRGRRRSRSLHDIDVQKKMLLMIETAPPDTETSDHERIDDNASTADLDWWDGAELFGIHPPLVPVGEI